VNKANEVIDAVLEVYGGAEAIANLNTVARKSHFTTWATNQSLRPAPPWDETETENWQAINLDSEQFRSYNAGSGGGFDFENGQLINGDEAYAFNYRAGTYNGIPAPDFNTASGPLIRVTAPLLVKQLQDRRQTAHWLGEADFEGRPHDIVTLVMEVGPGLSLYFDRETRLLTRAERVLPPFGQVDYRFRDYQTIDGIPFAARLELFANDLPNLVAVRHETLVNPDFGPYLALPEGLERIETPPVQPTEVALQELDEGVFLVGANGTYVLFVEMDDHVVSIGGTAGVPERIAALREVVADKPIRYGVLSHHHNDHLVAVPAYEAEGAEIFTVRAHEQVVRDTAENGEVLKLRFVDRKAVLESGGRSIELHDIGPTPHTEHLVVAFLPESGLLFEADHFPNPGNGRFVPAQPVTRHLARAITERGLQVKTVVGAHTPWQASWEELMDSLALEPKRRLAESP
ncbi:MAG TPA: MBL fold metallo-hydrolase, partial [Xanthomonadales bacterium]|nr:MBL fold metallo-hydrolase [Xanthomonadales bacterium]